MKLINTAHAIDPLSFAVGMAVGNNNNDCPTEKRIVEVKKEVCEKTVYKAEDITPIVVMFAVALTIIVALVSYMAGKVTAE